MSTVQAVILAGGEGKRIHPLGINKPKSMFEIMGKPLIQYVIEGLKERDIKDIIVVTGPGQEQIRDFLGQGSQLGVTIRYAVQEEPLGQANALQTVESLVQNHFFVLNANDIFESSLLLDMMKQSERHQASLVLAGRDVDEPWRFGVMRFENEKLIGVTEKPPRGEEPSQIAVVGVYYFSPEIFHYIRTTPATNSDDQLERAYQNLIDAGKGTYVRYRGFFESYKYPWNLLTINDLLLSKVVDRQYINRSAQISDLAVITGNVVIEENVRIFENAVIRGPAFIGKDTIIGNNTLVWGGCSLGRGCVIGFGSEVKNVVFGQNVWTHRAYVGDSIVSDNCSFGAGTVTANWRFDDQNITVNIKGDHLDTGLNKFGVIMAEGCRTGSNSVLLPGVKIGPNSIVGPGVTLAEDLPPDRVALLQKNASYRIVNNRLNLVKKPFGYLASKVITGTKDK